MLKLQTTFTRRRTQLPLTTRGFTLAEVLIGSMTLMLVLLPIFLSISQSFWVIDKARTVTTASSVAQSLFEQMRMQTYANTCTKYCHTATPTINQSYPYSSTAFATDLSAENFDTRSINSIKVSGTFVSPKSGQLEVELSIQWKDMVGQTQQHKFFTIISEGGLSDNVNKGW